MTGKLGATTLREGFLIYLKLRLLGSVKYHKLIGVDVYEHCTFKKAPIDKWKVVCGNHGSCASFGLLAASRDPLRQKFLVFSQTLWFLNFFYHKMYIL